MRGWWIVTFPSGAAGPPLAELPDALQKQLRAWSRIQGASDAWWAIDNFDPPSETDTSAQSLLEAVREFVVARNPTASVHSTPRLQHVDGTRLDVALIGDYSHPRTRGLLLAFGAFLRAHRHELFPGASLHAVALLHIPLHVDITAHGAELARGLAALREAACLRDVSLRPFERVYLFQGSNQDAENRLGYESLEATALNQLIGQLLFHLMLVERLPGGDSGAHAPMFFAGGAAAVICDGALRQERLARVAGEAILRDLQEPEKAPFVDVPAAKRTADGLAEQFAPARLFAAFANHPERPSFRFAEGLWAGARDAAGRPVSPWWPFGRRLYAIYFRIFLYWLPFRLGESARVFLHGAMNELHAFLRSRGDQIWKGEVDGLQLALRIGFERIIAGDVGPSRGLRQVRLVAAELANRTDPAHARRAIAELAAQHRLHVFEIPAFLEPHVASLREVEQPDAERMAYDRLVEAVRAHPLPSALLLRAGLLSLLAAFSAVSLVKWLSMTVIDLPLLTEWPWLSRVLFAAVPLAAALLTYSVGTLRLIDKRRREYVAAVLHAAQKAAVSAVQDAVEGVLREVRQYGDWVTTWTEKVAASLHYPEADALALPHTAFQTDIFTPFERRGPGPAPTAPDEPAFRIQVDGRRLLFQDLASNDRVRLLEVLLDTETGSGPTWRLLSESLPGTAGKEPSAAGMALSDRARRLALHLYHEAGALRAMRFMDERLAEILARLAFPAARLQTPRPVSFDWCASSPDDLPPEAVGLSARRTRIDSPVVVSVAGTRPVEVLTDIAVLTPLGDLSLATSAVLEDPVVIIAAALVQIAAPNDPIEIRLLNGTSVRVPEDRLAQVVELLAPAAAGPPGAAGFGW